MNHAPDSFHPPSTMPALDGPTFVAPPSHEANIDAMNRSQARCIFSKFYDSSRFLKGVNQDQQNVLYHQFIESMMNAGVSHIAEERPGGIFEPSLTENTDLRSIVNLGIFCLLTLNVEIDLLLTIRLYRMRLLPPLTQIWGQAMRPSNPMATFRRQPEKLRNRLDPIRIL